MVKTRNLKSWTEFRTISEEIRCNYGYHEIPLDNGQTYKHKNIILFRGQASAGWPLQPILHSKGIYATIIP